MDENKRRLIQDLLRNAGGMASAARAVVQPMIGEIPAGLSGLGTMMLTGDMDKAAENTNAVKRAFEYEPNERGAEYLGALGTGLGKAYDTAKKLDPKLEGDIAALRGGWEKFSTKAPGTAALAAGVMGVIDPSHGKGKAVVNTAEEAARIAALRAVRESTPRGPVFVSAVEEAIPTLQERGTVKQYVGQLKNKPGVKGEELSDLGLHELEDKPVTREEFLELVRGRRPRRDETRLGFSELDPQRVKDRVNDLAQERIRVAAGNPSTFENLGLEQFMPEGFQHPDVALTNRNRNNSEAWQNEWSNSDKYLDAALTHIQDQLRYSRDPMERQLANDWNNNLDDSISAERLDEVEEQMHERAISLIDQLPNNPVAFQNVFGDKSPEGLTFDEFNKKYGYARGQGTSRDLVDDLEQQIWGNNDAVHHVNQRVQAEVLRNPYDFSWPYEDAKKLGQYANMRYYSDIDTAGPKGYTEILEHQGPLAHSRDPRQTREPHWGDTESRGNDVTMHMRVDEVQTPEGNPALMLNELQSKYATQVGNRGTTMDPLELKEVGGSIGLDDQMKEARFVVNEARHLDNDEFERLFTQHPGNSEWDAEFFDGVQELAKEARDGLVNKEDIDERLQELYEIALERNGPPQLQIQHRGQRFLPDNDRAYDNEFDAMKRIEELQAGGGIGFKKDPRMPPRAGIKTWRLRGLKRALREAADRGYDDLYFPTGQQMPRIEKWAEGEMDNTDARGFARPLDELDKDVQQHVVDAYEDPGMEAVMRNYEERLPKEWAPYLKKFGAKIERSEMLPASGDKALKATAQRIRFTPELLAEVLRGQKAYQIAAGASLLPLLLRNEEEQSY